MDSDLARKAVEYALQRAWKEAVDVNREILAENPEDTETLNRLSRAYFESGDLKKARLAAEKVLKIDVLDPIANRNLLKWKTVKSIKNNGIKPSQASDFIEEPGKTKLVTLLCPGDKKILTELNAGDEVILATHAHRVCVVTVSGKYLGRLPDDLAARLKRLVSQGNEYQVFVKSLGLKEIKVFIRETKRVKKLLHTPSFLSEKREVFITPEDEG